MAIDNSKKIRDYLLRDTNYVSAGDGEIYLGNILLDECYDIQYSYREMKEPIYGYRSQYYSAVIPGTILITGQFTINYIHDAYLYTLLTAQNEQQDNTISSALSKSNDPMLKEGIKNKNLLQQYNYLRKKIDEESSNLNTLRSQQAIMDAKLNAIEEAKDRVNENAVANSKNLEKQQNDWVESMWSSEDGKQERLADATEANNKYNLGMDAYQRNKSMIEQGDYQGLMFDYSDEINQSAAIIQLKIDSDSSDLFELEKQLADPNFLAPLDQTDISALKENLEVWKDKVYKSKSELYSLNEQYKTAVSKFIEPGFFNTDARDLARFQASNTENALSEKNQMSTLLLQQDKIKQNKDDIQKKIKNIENLNAQLNAIKKELSVKVTPSHFITSTGDSKYKKLDSASYISAAIETNAKIVSYRPEDYTGDITITFRYNDLDHKVISGVKLLGHSHLLGVGGQPVQETYTFVARQILNSK